MPRGKCLTTLAMMGSWMKGRELGVLSNGYKAWQRFEAGFRQPFWMALVLNRYEWNQNKWVRAGLVASAALERA